MKAGQLKFYCYGTVAENKELTDPKSTSKSKFGNWKVKVHPSELRPFVDGEINGDSATEKAKGTDAGGAAYEVEVEISNVLEAEWFPMGTGGNRRTAPDVRRGAAVALYRFGDTDKYFWTTLYDDASLRKLETVVWGISATKDEAAEAGPDNMYYFELSSHGKLVHFHTSQANGEPFGYDVQIDTDKGILTFRDTDGNIFNLDSAERRLELINGDGSHIDLHHKSLKIFTAEDVQIETKAYKLKCQTSDTTATAVTLKADTQAIEAKTTHKGDFTETGNLTVIGAINGKKGTGGGGTGKFEGSLETTETFSAQQGGTFGGTMKAEKVVSTQPISAPNV